MERTARIILALLLAAALIPLVMRFLPDPSAGRITLHARMPENGGWQMDTIQARVGEELHLRLTSDDVQHSFAIGQVDLEPVNIAPGEWKDITLVFDRPGKYTYYCTRWCGPEHWRMRGTIEVTGSTPTRVPTSVSRPLYLSLNIDLDAPHMAAVVPGSQPSPERGAALKSSLPAYALDAQTYRASSPSQLWQRLRAEPDLAALTDADLWDAVVWVWQSQSTPQQIETARQLYARDCAACHGEDGRGDGVMARSLPTAQPHAGMPMSGDMRIRPPDLTDPAHTLGASPALLEGKLLRGGMGTGMPMWGTIFTPQELEALVAYLYTLIQY